MNCDYCKKTSENSSVYLLPELLIMFSNKHLQSNFTNTTKLCTVCVKRVNNIFHSRINKAMEKKRLLLEKELSTLTVREASNKEILDGVFKRKLLQRKKPTNSNSNNMSQRIMSSESSNTSNYTDKNEYIPEVAKTIVLNSTGG